MDIINIEPFRAMGFRTVQELSQELGYSEGAIWNWVRRGHLAVIRIDGTVYTLPTEVIRCAESRGMQGMATVKARAAVAS